MKRDPGTIDTIPRKLPPLQGRGSGKDAWRDLALKVLGYNDGLSKLINEQRGTILEMTAEIALLREQIASRKPVGSQNRMSDDTVAAIERGLAAGRTTRSLAAEHGVSAMAISRVGKRVKARKAYVRNTATVTAPADVTISSTDTR